MNTLKLIVTTCFMLVSYSFAFSGVYTKNLSVSIVIPCYYGHFSFLLPLLAYLSIQTVLPNEVVISISESGRIPEGEIIKLKNMRYKFSVRIISTKEKCSAGENRNIACKYAKGDVLITQDADDVPHPQRIEIIKYFFTHYDVNHVIHQFIPHFDESSNIYDWKFYDLKKIQHEQLREWGAIHNYVRVTNGNIAVRRKVCATIKWPNKSSGEDMHFNNAVCDQFKKTMFIHAGLLVYRAQFSSILCARKK